MVIQKFYSISPSSYENMDALMKTALCDKIPAVMGASLNYFLDRVKVNPQQFKDLTSSFVVILK